MKKYLIQIPPDVDFRDLRLSRDTKTGCIEFNWHPIEQICAASGIDVAVYRDTHEDNVAGLIISWYHEHLARGGAPDPVCEELILEVRIEDEHGGGISHKPGRA